MAHFLCVRNTTGKCQKCPSDQLINKFLVETTDIEGILAHDDQICFACYKAQLAIIKQIENPQTSTDSDLEKLLNDTKSDVPNVEPESDDVGRGDPICC